MLALSLLLLSAGLGAAGEHPGRALFDAAGCRACHRVGTKGGNTGPDLTLVGLRRSPEWLDIWLRDPRAWKKDTLMPSPRLSARARRAVVEYLATLTRRGPEAYASGREVYVRAGCVACHGAGGKGGHPNNNVPGGMIPALDVLIGTYTREELESRIVRGSRPAKADGAGAEPLVAMPSWTGVLSDGELDALVDHLFTLAPKTKAQDW